MVEKSSHKVHPQGIKYRNEFYWHPFLRDYISEYVQIYDFDQSFCHSISVLTKGKYLCQAEPLVHQGIIEADRLKLIHHLEEQKQQKRIVSKQVSTVKLILKSAKVNTSRYVDAPEPSSEGNHIAYVESIDTERDSSQAVVLSPTANTLAEIRDAQLKAIDNIIRSQNESPLNNYYIQKNKISQEYRKRWAINQNITILFQSCWIISRTFIIPTMTPLTDKCWLLLKTTECVGSLATPAPVKQLFFWISSAIMLPQFMSALPKAAGSKTCCA